MSSLYKNDVSEYCNTNQSLALARLSRFETTADGL